MFCPKTVFDWKVNLLVYGCRISPHIHFSSQTALKKIHLYSHSDEKIDKPIPDDLLLPNQVIVRLRYRSTSHFVLESDSAGYYVKDERIGAHIPVELIRRPNFSELSVGDIPVTSICSFLGTDLLGITPSNYCFYFGQKKQCKFCEILPTYKNEVDFPKTFKSLDVIKRAVLAALKSDNRLKFLAITTGNIQSYDETVDYFAQIGEQLQKDEIFQQVEQVLATLMPPDDLSKISLLREKGFTKVYFPLEVFDPEHFRIVCPGKSDYGYEKILCALEKAVEVFGLGNVYTNFVYGIQSLNSSLDPKSYDPDQENSYCLKAVKEMLSRSVIPAFTLYHFGGYNTIGNLELNGSSTNTFFRTWGELVQNSKLISCEQEAVLFGPQSLSNTLFNDGFQLAAQKENVL